jgi:hypothetical protein
MEEYLSIPLVFLCDPQPEDARLLMTAKGEWARPTLEGDVRELYSSLTTKKMLSAIREMSNIFLHLGLNIDIAQIKIFLPGARVMEAGLYWLFIFVESAKRRLREVQLRLTILLLPFGLASHVR